MSSCGLKASMETPAPLVTSIINNAVNKPVIYYSPHISQMLHQIIRILHFCLVDFSAESCLRFCSQLD